MITNVEFARMLYNSFLNGRIDVVVGHCAEHVRWECVGNPSYVPHAGVFEGRAGVARFFENLDRVYVFELFSPDRFHASGEHVFCFGRAKARSTATGITVNNRFLHTFTVHNGQLLDFVEFSDTAAIAVGAGTLGSASLVRVNA